MFSVDPHRTSISNNPRIRITLLFLPSFFQFNLFHSSIDDAFHKFMSILVFELIVISLTFNRQYNIGLLRTCSVLNGIFTCDSFAVFYHMMLSGWVFHRDKSSSRGHLPLIVEFRLTLVIVFILESLKQVMSSFLGAVNLLHLLPHLLNV